MSKRPPDGVATVTRLAHAGRLDVAVQQAEASQAASELKEMQRGLAVLRRAGCGVLAERCAPLIRAAEMKHKALADGLRYGRMCQVELDGKLDALKGRGKR